MTNNLNHPFLQFDFSTEDGANQAPLLFSNPLNIITTHTYDMVPYCLEQIEQAVLDGQYVAGYFSYELAYVFSQDTELHHVKNHLPLLWFGVFKNPTDERHTANNQKDFHVGNWKMQTSKQAYQDNFHKIMEAIKNKQTKQINYTVPFQASFCLLRSASRLALGRRDSFPKNGNLRDYRDHRRVRV